MSEVLWDWASVERVVGASPQTAGHYPHLVALQDGFGVDTGHGLLEVPEAQLAGKRPMAAALFVRVQRELTGSIMGM